MRRLAVITAAAALLAGAGAASAAEGPFGIAMGAQVAKLDGAKRFKPGWYTVTPPEPDGQFRQVAVEAFRSTGVCVVQAASPVIAGDADGAKVRAAIDHLAETYSTTFGKAEKLDSCKSLICAPELWGEDLLAGDRRYGYRWQLRGGQLPKVREVSLVAVAHSVSSFTYLVEYQSEALTACHANEGALE